MHAIQYATQNPERFLIAVERTHTRFAQLKQRAHHHAQLKNLIPVHADAIGFVTHHLDDQSLEQIFLLYPNPYPKAKHSNLRWHNSPFMSLLLKKLKTGGTLTIATNLEWYACEAQTALVRAWNLQLTEARQVSPDAVARTHFEKKYLARGETCWNLKFRKVQ